MKRVQLLAALLAFILLSGCQGETYSKVPIDKDVLLSVDLLDQGITFIDLNDPKNTVKWLMEEPFTGAVLFNDQKTVLLYGKKMEEAVLYNTEQGKKMTAWETGTGIVNALVSKDGQTVYFADQDRDVIRFFSITGEELGEAKVGNDPLTLLQDEQANLIYAVNFHDATLSVVDAIQQTVVDTIEVQPASTGGVLLAQKNELWLGGHGEGTELQEAVMVYSLEKKQETAKIAAPVMPVALTFDDGFVYAVSHGTNELRKIDPNTKEIVAVNKVGANPFDIIAAASKLYIASYDSEEVIAVDPVSLEITDTYQVGKGPFHLIHREGIK